MQRYNDNEAAGKDGTQSKALIGWAVMVAGMILHRFGWTLDDHATSVDLILQILAGLAEVGGAAVGLWGNLRRTQPIVSLFGVPLRRRRKK